MATHMESKDINAKQVVPYQSIRGTLRSGDLLFASGEYLVSKAIRKATRSPWSHVGIVFKLKDVNRVLLLESVESMGVRFVPLSKYILNYRNRKPYKGTVVLGRCSSTTNEVVVGLAKFGIDELTRPYDKDEIAKILARIIIGEGKRERDREYICSELVYECYANVGVKFDYDRRGFVSPENIWTSDKISYVCRVL